MLACAWCGRMLGRGRIEVPVRPAYASTGDFEDATMGLLATKSYCDTECFGKAKMAGQHDGAEVTWEELRERPFVPPHRQPRRWRDDR